MSDNMDLFSGNVCRKVITETNGTIKSPNLPLPYPENADCLWITTLEKFSKIKIQISAFDLSRSYGTMLEITVCGYPHYFFGNKMYKMTIEIEAKCQSIVVVFKTTENKGRHYGFLLKYYSYENPLTLIASNKSAKGVTLNTKGMYVEYVILIIERQSSLHKS